MDEIIIVSGVPRSGTSLMMQMLKAGGIEILSDDKRVADINNPEGYFEYDKVNYLPEETEWLKEARGKAVKILYHKLIYLPGDYEYKVILMRRDNEEINLSQNKMAGTKASIDYEEQIKIIRDFMLLKNNFSFIEIFYNRLLSGQSNILIANIDIIRIFLQREMDITAMISQIKPELYRNRKES